MAKKVSFIAQQHKTEEADTKEESSKLQKFLLQNLFCHFCNS
jgi:hypothetical protein